MEYNIAVVKGDGIGPEIVTEAMKVLDKVGEKFGHNFHYQEVLAGGCSIDANGVPLTEETIEICKNADSVLLGAVGGPKWDEVPSEKRPEKALLGLRAALGLFVNLRPAQMHKALSDACPIKPEIIGDGFDILVCRELTGDVYFGKHYRRESDKGWGEVGADDMNYSVYEVERIGRRAFEMAMKRNRKVCSVDKANVLETSRVWRETMHRIKDEYPEVEYSDMYVDNCAMQLVRNPGQFDVIVTGNLFGDILSDEASMITGSIGMLPSASMNETGKGMYEPIHGSAPDIAGKGIANPIATILSCAMMLRYSFGLKDEADAIENAVEAVLDAGHRTADIAAKGEKVLSTSEMGELIRAQL
ncbi:3-isopropylmalate dehydrogenase [Agathobaculum sp.]|uniref:3-isopropylmalate dehydrogenase n=1 Tax=Agathobaculum sp. TaxID=2048138 RepID=UPI0039A04140